MKKIKTQLINAEIVFALVLILHVGKNIFLWKFNEEGKSILILDNTKLEFWIILNLNKN